jgi:DNA-directed RNA polymerase subunit N (RpoN/RPB10)
MSDARRSTYIVIFNRRTDDYGFGRPLRVLWECDTGIAKAVCSDPRTAGKNHFLGWVWKGNQRVEFVEDDGRYDKVLADLGIAKRGHRLEWAEARTRCFGCGKVIVAPLRASHPLCQQCEREWCGEFEPRDDEVL